MQPPGRLIVTDLVVAFPPEPLATFLAEGGYLPRGVPLIKRILALPEQTVCRKDLAITVDGIEMGAARERDRRGRLLPVWQGCRVVRSGEVFLMNWDEPASLDSRYFGPLPLTAIVGRADPNLDLRGGMIVSPVCNCPAVRQRQPALAPFPARILRAKCVMVVNGTVRSDSPRRALTSTVAGLRHDLNGAAAAVRAME